MAISMIVAAARNRAIGKDGQIPWQLPDDFAYFRRITTGHHIIMGRKTLESIGRALPKRTNIVITRTRAYSFPGVTVAHSLEEALALCVDDPEPMFIGGGEIYREALPLTQRIYLTRVETSIEDADAFFPHLSSEWVGISSQCHPADDKHAYVFNWVVYERKKSAQEETPTTPDSDESNVA